MIFDRFLLILTFVSLVNTVLGFSDGGEGLGECV